MFNTTELTKLDYSPKHLKGYIGILSCFCFYLLAHYVGLLSYALLLFRADMVINAEKRRMLAEAAAKRKASVGPSDIDVAAPAGVATVAIFAPSPTDLRQKGAIEATASGDEDTCSGLVFKRKKGADVAVPVHSASDGCASSFRENPPSASSPRDLVVHKGGGKVPLEVTLARLPLLSCLPFSKRFFKPSEIGR